jgi:hypothetical protein
MDPIEDALTKWWNKIMMDFHYAGVIFNLNFIHVVELHGNQDAQAGFISVFDKLYNSDK